MFSPLLALMLDVYWFSPTFILMELVRRVAGCRIRLAWEEYTNMQGMRFSQHWPHQVRSLDASNSRFVSRFALLNAI
jgi:hypothetical protein